MNLPKVVIDENYRDYLDGKEVEATVLSSRDEVREGTLVMAFHNSIAGRTDVPTPRDKQSHYVGIEGRVTAIHPAEQGQRHIRIVKI
jgi:hypothetical protein